MGAVLGVDGCRAGWIGVLMDGSVAHWRLLSSAAEVLAVEAAATGIDVPIGLPTAGARSCDVLARQLLGPRRSSVFPAPVRAVLGATSHAEACAGSRAQHGQALSVQAFCILDKIADVDSVMTPELQSRVVEVHPEVSFTAMANRHLLHPKRRRAGLEERLAVLRQSFSAVDELLAERPPQAKIDDALDALAAAWTAQRWAAGAAQVLPTDDQRDGAGLRMQIVY